MTILAEPDLFLLLKQAPGNPAIWNRFLSELNRQLKTDFACLFISHFSSTKTDTHNLYSDHVTKDLLTTDQPDSIKANSSFNQFLSQNHYRVCFSQPKDFFDSSQSSSLTSAIEPNRFHAGLSIPCHNQFSLCLMLSRNQPFQQKEQLTIKALLNRLSPHLELAIHQEQRLKIKHQLFHLLNRPFDAFIILDQYFKILFLDPIERTILKKMACLEITRQSFDIKNPALKKKLTTLFQNSEDIQSFRAPCYFFQITCIPVQRLNNLYHWECFNEGFILVFFHDKNQNDNLERLKTIYRLSNSEAICALHFIETPSVNVIAENTFRSSETVRNHLKHIMQKMAVHTQAELMKKLISLIIL